jgi:glycosyltransferase involved in cell wall biosynthesis
MKENDKKSKRKRVLILAPFFGINDFWIDGFCRRSDFEFKKASYLNQPVSWHKRGANTSPAEWLRHFKYAHQAMKWRSDCIVTCFPQLALVAAALLPFTASPETRLVAWHFNLGSLSSRWKGYFAGKILRRVDRFVVHASSEIGSYARWLGIDEERFRFFPLQRGKITGVTSTPIQKPYIVSMGSANRDYRTLVDAVHGTGIKTVMISKKTVIDSLPNHPNLVKLTDLTQEECNSILSGAEMNVVPIATNQTASGQVTFTISMHMGIPTIATQCIGTVDYIRNGETGLLVPPGDARALRQAIECLWHDQALRARIGSAGRRHAEKYFSDEAAGRYFAQVLDEVLE